MISITGILKEGQIMNNRSQHTAYFYESWLEKIKQVFAHIKVSPSGHNRDSLAPHPFWVIVSKEISDHVRSWRFIILVALIALTCMGSLYTSLAGLGKAAKETSPEGGFFFLRLFTLSDGTMPSFFVFLGFLGPLLGIGLGFDAVNSEHNKGTLSRVLSQPIHRDYIINAKFTASIIVISVMLFALSFLVMGLGIILIGIPPTAEEFMRIIIFTILSIVYVAFWLNLSILFSVRFRQPATSALAGIAIWLFVTVFYIIIANLIVKALAPPNTANPQQIYHFEQFRINLMRILPNELYSEATTTLLMPSVRSLGPLTMEQVYGTIPGPLPLGQSLLLVWPQVTGLIAATILCFVLSYISFMRKEIRPR
jgi:ABC-2 type transport system permease protein